MRHSLPLFTALLLLLLGGLDVTQGGDKPTSKDLGKIEPPGGVPLDFGRPGTPIKVDAVEKARKRLESVAAEDLDKWVVELERIMNEKLDGELAKQACRTYFVSRMSVTFDDLQSGKTRWTNSGVQNSTPRSTSSFWMTTSTTNCSSGTNSRLLSGQASRRASFWMARAGVR
jgi:hypothetical protein